MQEMAGVKIEELGNTSDDEAYGTPTHDAQQDETNAQFHDPSFEPGDLEAIVLSVLLPQ